MKAHKRDVYSIPRVLSKIAELIEAVLSEPVDDEEYIQMSPPAPVDNITKRLLVVEDSLARITQPSDLSQFHELDQSKFDLHRPPKHTTLPLALLHPIFTEFVANVEHHKPIPTDNALVRNLREAMSETWKTN
jgi:hypothetical protein